MIHFRRPYPLPEIRQPTRAAPPPLFTRVSMLSAVDALGVRCYAITVGLLPLGTYYPRTGDVIPSDADAALFLGALNMELDGLTNPRASSDPDIYALDAFLARRQHGWSNEEAFLWMVELNRANRIGERIAPYQRLQGLA